MAALVDPTPRVLPLRWQQCQHKYRPAGVTRRVCYQDGSDIEQVEVSCGSCDVCIARRVHEVTGRAIGESWGCQRAYMVTLTYGGDRHFGSTKDNPNAQEVNAAHIKSYIKRLRKYTWYAALLEHKKAGGDRWSFEMKEIRETWPKMRVFWAGEYGTRKDRPHFHLIVYCYNCDGPPELPEWAIGEDIFHGAMDRTMEPYLGDGGLVPSAYALVPGEAGRMYWPWGWSNWDEFGPNSAKYVSKYAVKSVEERVGAEGASVTMPGRSTRPMLGSMYFDYLATGHVDGQLPVADRLYYLPKLLDWTHATKYFMNKAAMMYFCRSFERQWYERARTDDWLMRHPPTSAMLDQYHGYEYKRLEEKRLHAIELEEAAEFRRVFRKGLEQKKQEALQLELELMAGLVPASAVPEWSPGYRLIRDPLPGAHIRRVKPEVERYGEVR